jgi:3-oxoacyl-[acyl-carrier protein] reductase
VSAEYGRQGVRMNVVNPGLIATPAVASLLTEGVTDTIPSGRPGRPEEVARTVVFLAAPGSGYIAGQVVDVDGGACIRSPIPGPGTDRSMAG